MIQGQTDSVSSPARPTGVLSEAPEVLPKPERQVEQNDNISKIQNLQLSRIEVVTDAVPSPARPRETVKTPEESERKVQTAQNLNCPSTSPPKSEIPRDKSDQSEPRQSSGFSTRRPHDRSKTDRSKTDSKPGSKTNINFKNCTNFTFGPVFHQYIAQGKNTQFEEDSYLIKRRESRMKRYNKLLSSPDELLDEDIIIVSESLDDRGLHSLLKELPMDEKEADQIKREFRSKGHSEVIFQILTHWMCLMSKEDQKPRLNLFSSKLLSEEVYQNGGKRALKGLLENHSYND